MLILAARLATNVDWRRCRRSKLEILNHDNTTLTPAMLRKINAYWRAANYVSVGQIYLYDNPLLKRPLEISDVKPLVVSHWGTTPGQNFIYVHLNRSSTNMTWICSTSRARVTAARPSWATCT